jgi:flagellar basal-body rod modification protein FlgD
MSVSAPNTANSTIGPTQPSGTASSVAGSLNEGDFLNLMMDQMKNQDPLNPSDPTQYMSELASFSSLDEQIQIQESSAQSASNQAASAALQMLGQNANYTDSNGNSGSGTVTAVDFTSAGPTLTIGGTSGISLSEITSAGTSTSTTSSQGS